MRPCVPWPSVRFGVPVPCQVLLCTLGSHAADAWLTVDDGGAAAYRGSFVNPGRQLAVEHPPFPGTRRASVPDEPTVLPIP